MIYHSKGLDLVIIDFEYHHDLTYIDEIIPSHTSRYVIRGYYIIMRNGVSQKGEARRAEQ